MKRLLIVTYYFPPAGGVAVQRVLKFVKYLRDFNVEPVVLTVSNGAYPKLDHALEAEVPEGVAVYRTASLDPFGVYAKLTGKRRTEAIPAGSVGAATGLSRLARWLRANIFIPDARVGWVPFAVREALRLHAEYPFDAVFTSGPPHSSHLIGRALKRRAHLPWVADFRDLWTGINYAQELPITLWAHALTSRLEQSVLQEADQVVTVSPSWAKELERIGGCPVEVIHNGYDEDDFQEVWQDSRLAPDYFILAYVGSLYASRNPVALWKTLADLRNAGELVRLRLRLIGSVDDVVRQSLATYKLDVDEVGHVSHDVAVREMARSTLLLLLIEPFDKAEGMLTGKLYEYLASGRPVLGLGPPRGDAAELLIEAGAGRMFDQREVGGIVNHLRSLYIAWENDIMLPGAYPQAIHSYSRHTQASQLAEVIRKAAS